MQARSVYARLEPTPFVAKLALLFTTLASGCGSSQEPAQPKSPASRGRTIALTPIGQRDNTERIGRTLDVAGELEAFTTSLRAPSVSSIAGRPAIRLEDVDRQHISLADHFEPEQYARVAVHLHGQGRIALEAQWRRAGEIRLQSYDASRIEGDGDWQVVLLDFPRPAPDEEPYDQFSLRAFRPQGTWFLGAIDLIERPLRRRLPLAEEGAELVAVAQEARLGFGLATETPLRGQFRAPTDALLEFSYGWPDELPDRRPAAIVVDLRCDDERRRERYEFPQTGRTWKRARIDLSDWTGRDVRVQFRLKVRGREALCALGQPRTVVAQPDPATVVLITSDTHRADHIGQVEPLGDSAASRSLTPWLDRLAERGVRFTDCFSSTNVTLPSHVALMTGVHPRDTGIHVNKHVLSAEATTLAERFRSAGWRTYAAVSMRALGRPSNGVVQGFERVSWSRNVARDAEKTVSQIATWMQEAEGQPLFVWLHVFDAHTPYTPPEQYELLFYPRDRDRDDPALPEPRWTPEGTFAKARDPDWFRALYRSEVRYLDDSLAALEELERFDGAVVAFTADHGEALGEHDIWWRHNGLWTEAIHIPLILTWPGAPRGTTVSEPVRQIDVGRTLLALAGCAPKDFPGRDLSQLATLGERPEPRYTLSEGARAAAVTYQGWHLILGLEEDTQRNLGRDGHTPFHDVRLYDLDVDPDCETDLSTVESERAQRLRSLCVAWLTQASDRGWSKTGTLDAAAARELAELGYADHIDASEVTELFDAACRCDACQHFE